MGSVSAFGCGYFSTAIERSEVWTGLLFLVGREIGPFLGDLALLICAFTTGVVPLILDMGLHCIAGVPSPLVTWMINSHTGRLDLKSISDGMGSNKTIIRRCPFPVHSFQILLLYTYS